MQTKTSESTRENDNEKLQAYPLLKRLPDSHSEGECERECDSGELLDRFLAYCEERGLTLYPAQEEAILEIFDGKNVILNTPTGSGKSMVALAMHFRALALKRRSFYTCPIKALVNEKFISLCFDFGPDKVGLITGDASVNRDAPIICCTAEILANMALRSGEGCAVDDVVMDEFHYYADRERGVAWQIPLLTLTRARFLLMSATLGDSTFFAEELSKLTGVATKSVVGGERPVPLEFSYEEYPLEMVLERLVSAQKAPIYMVNFTQRECAENAQALTCVNYCSKEEKQEIAKALEGVKFSTPYGKDISRYLRHGIGIHHAGLLPRYRILVEKLAQRGLLKIIVGTDTLGVGINVPIRTVLFTKLCKYNGEKVALLTARDFHQIAGRAGRKGFDESGTVVVMAPSYIIENKMNEEKAKAKGKKAQVKVRPPDKNFVLWRHADYERLLASPPEPLKSSFKVSAGMLLQVLSRESGDGCRAMKRMIASSHESEHIKKRLKGEAFLHFRSLVERKIIEFIKPGPGLRLNLHLQEDFSLHHALSLFVLDAVDLIDPYAEDYALKILTICESVVEDPDAILNKQLDRVKRDLIFELKTQGVPYEERMEELEKVEWPKPERDFIYNNFNAFKARYPWIGEENISPKSIVREMYESFLSFNDYIKEYALERSEGLLLRYLSDVYRVLSQTLPEQSKNEAVMDAILYFEQMIREVDSSLLEEWERLKDPIAYGRKELEKEKAKAEKAEELLALADMERFTNSLRSAIFRVVRDLSFERYEIILEEISNASEWSVEKLSTMMDAYYDVHKEIMITPNARNKRLTTIERDHQNQVWDIYQRLVDEEGDNDFALHFKIDLQDPQVKAGEAGSGQLLGLITL
ncbi:MAG: DUF3516 domain-containing protein [Oligoflexia bacterium]|nr:DUF3516 domain-containing protein [Oligoflexia bacterium]